MRESNQFRKKPEKFTAKTSQDKDCSPAEQPGKCNFCNRQLESGEDYTATIYRRAADNTQEISIYICEDCDSYLFFNPKAHLDFTENERRYLASKIILIYERWELSDDEQAAVLGVTKAELLKYKDSCPIDQNDQLLWRVGNILAISRLCRSYDINRPDRADRWVTSENELLGGKRPIDLMVTKSGMANVRNMLEGYGSR